MAERFTETSSPGRHGNVRQIGLARPPVTARIAEAPEPGIAFRASQEALPKKLSICD